MKKGKYLVVVLVFIISIGLIIVNFPSETILPSNTELVQNSLKVGAKTPEFPSIIGKSAITMVLGSNEVIYSKDANAKRYPASLTKLMTAYLFAKNATPDSIIPYTESAEEQPAFSLGKNFGPVYVGETMLAKYVMDALLLYSANDSAYMIADYVGGSKDNFVKMMNDEVQKLGLKGTHFMNPNGLQNPDHYTTAYDLAIIGQLPYSIPWSRETMGTKTATINFQNSDKMITINNRNSNLGKDGNVAGKTGYTDQAHSCLFNIDVRNGKTIVGVVMDSTNILNSPEMYSDMKKIMDYSYNVATQQVYEEAGTQIFDPILTYKLFGFFGPTRTIKVPMVLKDNIMYYNNPENNNFSNVTMDTNKLSAWDCIFNKSKVNVKFNELKYSKDYAVTPQVSIGQLIGPLIFAYVLLIIAIIAALAFILMLIRDINISRRKKKRKLKKNSNNKNKGNNPNKKMNR
ncbi:D-alanyl-D-alanine carboxypeptidase [uncultured Clostridium sp.]|uniref:D-alanyl-D-alanine carboxypeptidase family protein n=1 Tax=uncultured Clostridium sp. TaxID=59620 RepID=UPI002620E4FF|nr:D-alanyl-D-alanine carboxypeptidase [uncultured Clostridium sp.]